MKKIFNIKVATILVAIVAVLGAFGLLKNESINLDTTEDEKPYCKIKKEDVLHNVKPASDNYSLYDDYSFRNGIYNVTSRYYKFVDKLYKSESKLRKLKIQTTIEQITPEGVKTIPKEQQDALDKAKKEVEKAYQELLFQYKIYKPIALSLLNEVQRRQEIERKKGIKPEESYFHLYDKYSYYNLDDIDCIREEDENK